jgi:hypothetical protein
LFGAKESPFCQHKKDKPLKISFFRGFVVAGTGEISNFDLLKDLAKVVDFLTDSKSYMYWLDSSLDI